MQSNRESFYGHGGHHTPASIAKYVDRLECKGMVLDVGCGDGVAIEELKKRGVAAFGIDIVPENWRSIPAAIADGFALPFADATFDAAGCYAVIEHLSEPEKLLAEMIRVIKPGGKIVVSCPNMRGVFVLHPGHFATQRGFMQRIRNLAVFIKTSILSMAGQKSIPFEIFPPPDMTKIPENASDYNALCATNYAAIKHFLKGRGFRIEYVSAAMEYVKNPVKRRIMNIIDKIPFFRELFGGVFIVGVKKGK